MHIFILFHEDLLGLHQFLMQMRNCKSVSTTVVLVLYTSKDRPVLSDLLIFILSESQGSLRSALHLEKAALHQPQVGMCRRGKHFVFIQSDQLFSTCECTSNRNYPFCMIEQVKHQIFCKLTETPPKSS